jgi:phosphohistidine swiveling domain-containing protein
MSHYLSCSVRAVPSVGALVTDTRGSVTLGHYRTGISHPGSGRYGNATALLRDGQSVTVDGSAGIVEINS